VENKSALTQDGSHTLLSGIFGEHYHSLFGAVQESLHVFIEHGLRQLQHLPELHILEMGFGTGLNAWLSWQEKGRPPVFYTAYEAYPISKEDISRLNYAEGRQAEFDMLHQAEWETFISLANDFQLRKMNALFEKSPTEAGYHLVYYDAFSPGTQPELWTQEVFTKVFDSMTEGAILLTYCAKGDVKRALRGAGFTVERLAGPPGKKHMLRARKVTGAGLQQAFDRTKPQSDNSAHPHLSAKNT
jgi:tRNA U34 5-methylaminomethyl-2-thiouridine-forming methyltransferase MnmC